MFSKSEEDYLKAIYALQKEMHKNINTNLIAEKMQTKASSVTDMLKKLATKKLVIYIKYQGVYLTDKGNQTALKIIRKHRLWECFLVDKLNFNWNEVHQIAEQLEHIKSDELIDKLDAFLNFPKNDPHGDPIPDEYGNFPKSNSINISKMKIGEASVLEFVKDSSKKFLQYLDNKNLGLGDPIKIIDIEPFDHSIQIKTKMGELTISKNVAENLYLKNPNDEL